MSYRSMLVALAVGLDWWVGGQLVRPGWRVILAVLAVPVGLVLGGALGAWLPGPAAGLLGAGLLIYLGVFHLAGVGGVIPDGLVPPDGLTSRTLAAATGLALGGPAGPMAALWLWAGQVAGAVASRRGGTERDLGRRFRLWAAVVLWIAGVVGLLTSRGAT